MSFCNIFSLSQSNHWFKCIKAKPLKKINYTSWTNDPNCNRCLPQNRLQKYAVDIWRRSVEKLHCIVDNRKLMMLFYMHRLSVTTDFFEDIFSTFYLVAKQTVKEFNQRILKLNSLVQHSSKNFSFCSVTSRVFIPPFMA